MSPGAVDPSEHVFWLASRAAGVVALVLVSLSVGLGLALSGRISRRPGAPAYLRKLHEAIALSSLGAIVVHGALLLGDAYLRPGLTGILLPFQMENQPVWTGVGILAGWLAIIVGLSSYVQRWITAEVWRWLHRWTLAVYVMALAHTLGSGTDAGAPWLLAIIALTSLPIVFLASFRFLPGVRRAKRAGKPVRTFHRMRVARVTPLTAESVLIDFDLPDELRADFRFTPGQHLTVRTELDGRNVRRTYSICSSAGSGRLQIAVRLIDGGAFSSFAVRRLKAGDELEVMTPSGRLGAMLDPDNSNHYVGVAAGSGITPILSILTTALEVEPASRFTLLYGNRTRASTMFADELDRLEERYPGRLEVLHVRSREPQADPRLDGRIDRAKTEWLLASRLSGKDVAQWFLCGPVEMVTGVREVLAGKGIEPERVQIELFVPPVGFEGVQATRANGALPRAGTNVPAKLTIRLGGEEESLALGPGQSVLDGTLDVLPDAPYSCMGGTCGTCRAKVLKGSVEMHHNFALDEDEVEDGYVLTCQSRAASPALTVDYDA